jgi:hypothetical protein
MNMYVLTAKKIFKNKYLESGKFVIGYKDLDLFFKMKLYQEYNLKMIKDIFKNLKKEEKEKFEEIKNDKKKKKNFLKKFIVKKVNKKELLSIIKQSKFHTDKIFKKYKLKKTDLLKLKQFEDSLNFKVFSEKELKELKELKKNKIIIQKIKNIPTLLKKKYFFAIKYLANKFNSSKSSSKILKIKKMLKKNFNNNNTINHLDFKKFLTILNQITFKLDKDKFKKVFSPKFIEELSLFMFNNLEINTRKNAKFGMTMWQFENYFKFRIFPEIERKIYFTHWNMDNPYMVLINDNNDVEIYSRTKYEESKYKKMGKKHYSILSNSYKNVKKIYIGKDLRGESDYLYYAKWKGDKRQVWPFITPKIKEEKRFIYSEKIYIYETVPGNSILLQLNKTKLCLIKNAIFEFNINKDDKIIAFNSPIEGTDLPIPYIIGEKNLYILDMDFQYLKRVPYLQNYSDKKRWLSEDFVRNIIINEKMKKYYKNIKTKIINGPIY